jgi:hypothetical protein
MQAHGKTRSLLQSKSLRLHGRRQEWKLALRERMSSPPQSGHFRRSSFMGVERRISEEEPWPEEGRRKTEDERRPGEVG